MPRPKSYDRHEVLDRAVGLFWEKGFEGTHLGELVEVTGLNRFSLYNEFGGKAGLFAAALDHYVAGLSGLFDALDAEPLGLDNVRRFHRMQLDMGFRHGCFAVNTIREKHVVPAEAWQRVEAFSERTRVGLLKNLVAAREAGELPGTADPEVLALVLAIYDMGLLSYRSLGADPSTFLPLIDQIERLLE